MKINDKIRVLRKSKDINDHFLPAWAYNESFRIVDFLDETTALIQCVSHPFFEWIIKTENLTK